MTEKRDTKRGKRTVKRTRKASVKETKANSAQFPRQDPHVKGNAKQTNDASFRVEVSLVRTVTPTLETWLADLEAAIVRVVSASDTNANASVQTDIEAVHDLRVSMRRIRSLLRELRTVFGAFHVNRIREDLKFVGDATSVLRDLEVLQQTVEHLQLDPQDRAGLQTWLESLRQQERGARQRVIRLLQSGRLEDPINHLRALLVLPVPMGNDPEATGFARKVVQKARRKVERQHDASVVDVHALHQLRISYKRLRYTVEALAPVLSPMMCQWGSVAKKFQSILGDIHDHDVATEVVAHASSMAHPYMTEAVRGKLLAAIASKRALYVDEYLTSIGLSQLQKLDGPHPTHCVDPADPAEKNDAEPKDVAQQTLTPTGR